MQRIRIGNDVRLNLTLKGNKTYDQANIKELRCYSYTSNQDITDIYSIVEYIVNSSDIFKKEYAPTNNITNYFSSVNEIRK